MNIFVLDKNPEIAASMLCDAHVCKMIVESCQLLSTYDRTIAHHTPEELAGLFEATHQNHPCCLCLKNMFNYLWLVMHLRGLLIEYTLRYGKHHACLEMYHDHWMLLLSKAIYAIGRELLQNENSQTPISDFIINNTEFPKCMPKEYWVGENQFDDIDNVVASYRNYYKFKKQTLPRFTYKNGCEPWWLAQ